MRRRWEPLALALGLALVLVNPSFGDVIVGFERTGSMINIPTGGVLDSRFFSIGGSSCIKEEQKGFKNALRLNIGTPGGIELGFTGYASAVATHVQKSLFTNERVAISLGVQNVFFKTVVRETLLVEDPSFYGVVDNKLPAFFDLNFHLGMGTNRFVRYLRRGKDTYGVFGGLSRRFGPINLMAEYDGQNWNLGTRMTISEGVDLLLGVIGIENIGRPRSELECARFSGGLVFNVSRVPEKLVERGVETAVREAAVPSVEGKAFPITPERESSLRDSLNYYRKKADSLADSLDRYRYTLENLRDHLAYSRQRLIALEDSLYASREREEESQRNLNEALRLLSLSLRSFYAGDYPKALAEIKRAIDINPNIALAQARLGSVYYKMGKIDKATVSWEKALELDPDFEDVRNILNALHERRLRVMTFSTR